MVAEDGAIERLAIRNNVFYRCFDGIASSVARV